MGGFGPRNNYISNPNTHPAEAGAITLSTADSCEDRRSQKPDVLARHTFI